MQRFTYIKLFRDLDFTGPRVVLSDEPGWFIGVSEEPLPTQSIDNPPHEWGYEGAGPSQLAADILQYVCECAGVQDQYVETVRGRVFRVVNASYHTFKRQFLLGMPKAGGTLHTEAVLNWLNGLHTKPVLDYQSEPFDSKPLGLGIALQYPFAEWPKPGETVGDFELDHVEIRQINPGTGPILGETTEEQAIENMNRYIADSRQKYGLVANLTYERVPLLDWVDDPGRYTFMVYHPDYERGVKIRMPGVPLDKLWYIGQHDKNAYQFVRLYKQETSWLWLFGLLSNFDFMEVNGEQAGE